MIHNYIPTNQWIGVYVGYKGAKFINPTYAELANTFDIRMCTDGDWDSLLSKNTASNWATSGNRMDRTISGDFTVGGRGNNRNYHGKVASMVVTTLKRNDTMPTDAEIKLMITDPVKWVADYKVGNNYRYPTAGSTYPNFQIGDTQPAQATQVWLMGDGSNDSLMSNGIRNYVQTSDQNWTRLQANNLQANDEVNVSINGLS